MTREGLNQQFVLFICMFPLYHEYSSMTIGIVKENCLTFYLQVSPFNPRTIVEKFRLSSKQAWEQEKETVV